VGYFPNASDYKVTISYIQCKFDQIQGEAIVNACTAIKANDIEAATDCSAVKAGALLSGNKICVDDNTANAVHWPLPMNRITGIISLMIRITTFSLIPPRMLIM